MRPRSYKFCNQLVLVNRNKNEKYRGVRDDGSQAGVNEEVLSGIGVAPPEVDTSGIGSKGRRADFI